MNAITQAVLKFVLYFLTSVAILLPNISLDAPSHAGAKKPPEVPTYYDPGPGPGNCC